VDESLLRGQILLVNALRHPEVPDCKEECPSLLGALRAQAFQMVGINYIDAR